MWKAERKRIAMERIERLFELAEQAFGRRPELSDRYVRLAWRIATRYNVRFPPGLKRKFCRGCLSFWRPGATCRVRIRPKPSSRLVITCLKCGRVASWPWGP